MKKLIAIRVLVTLTGLLIVQDVSYASGHDFDDLYNSEKAKNPGAFDEVLDAQTYIKLKIKIEEGKANEEEKQVFYNEKLRRSYEALNKYFIK